LLPRAFSAGEKKITSFLGLTPQANEVRAVGEALGLPKQIVWRHPFPGPGLAVRLLGEITWERLETLRAADAILIEELWQSGWYHQTSQAFVVLLPVPLIALGLRRFSVSTLAL
jgi:GMP synthase (glutamine-hydrolysing)